MRRIPEQDWRMFDEKNDIEVAQVASEDEENQWVFRKGGDAMPLDDYLFVTDEEFEKIREGKWKLDAG